MNKIFYSVLFVSILFFACDLKNKSFAKLWLYTHSSGPELSRDTLLTPASFLLLNEDGSYTKDFGTFEYGTWDHNEKHLILTNQKNGTTVFAFTRPAPNELQLTTNTGDIANFESQKLPKPSGNPFSRENNKWRIRSHKKETDGEIRKKLVNHCQFWEAYFTWALNNELTSIDVRSTPTPIKIYGNGFAIKPFEELPATWKGYFFDEEDCRKATEQLTDAFDRHNIVWPKTNNKFKIFISAFQQLQQHIGS